MNNEKVDKTIDPPSPSSSKPAGLDSTKPVEHLELADPVAAPAAPPPTPSKKPSANDILDVKLEEVSSSDKSHKSNDSGSGGGIHFGSILVTLFVLFGFLELIVIVGTCAALYMYPGSIFLALTKLMTPNSLKTLAVVPTTHEVENIPLAKKAPVYTYAGVTFGTPWKKLASDPVAKNAEPSNVLKSTDGQQIIMYDPTKRDQAPFYTKSIPNDYNLRKEIYAVLPDGIKYTDAVNDASKKYQLMLEKSQILTACDKGMTITNFTSPTVHGFQYADACHTNPKQTVLDIFSDSGRYFTLVISAPDIQQKDIDTILSSFKFN